MATDPLAAIDAALLELDQHSARRSRRIVEEGCSTRVTVDGRTLLAFCSNDYLGLARHPAVVRALAEGARRYGAGSGASHLISGHCRAHADLEEKLAALFATRLDSPRALYLSSGYAANVALISTLAASGGAGGCEIFSEALNHASLVDGARLARGRSGAAISVYRHLDCEDLARLLARSGAAVKIIATDSVFSMDGEIAPLAALIDLAERYGAWLVVDDAHGFGVLGERGTGVLELLGLRSRNLCYVGTLGKAAGVAGAFIAAHHRCIEWLINLARPYIYSTAAPPAVACAVDAALDIITGEDGMLRRQQLRSLAAQWRATLRLRGWRLLPSTTPIQPVVVGSNEAALGAAAQLLARGLWVPAIRPPTVPPGTARLRVSLSAGHSAADVDRLTSALADVESIAQGNA